MKKLAINITKAQLTSFEVTLKDSLPAVSATITLLTAGGKPITSYTVGTNHWQDENKIDLPDDIVAPIVKAVEILETVVVRHCRDHQKAIGGAA